MLEWRIREREKVRTNLGTPFLSAGWTKIGWKQSNYIDKHIYKIMIKIYTILTEALIIHIKILIKRRIHRSQVTV